MKKRNRVSIQDRKEIKYWKDHFIRYYKINPTLEMIEMEKELEKMTLELESKFVFITINPPAHLVKEKQDISYFISLCKSLKSHYDVDKEMIISFEYLDPDGSPRLHCYFAYKRKQYRKNIAETIFNGPIGKFLEKVEDIDCKFLPSEDYSKIVKYLIGPSEDKDYSKSKVYQRTENTKGLKRVYTCEQLK